MSVLAVNQITDASGGATATINSFTPTVSNMAGRNRIINGAMMIDQRNAGAAVTTTESYVVDRWFNQNSITSGTITAQQSTDAPAGFYNSFIKTFTGVSYNATSGYAILNQVIEKNNIIDLAYGTSSAKTITVSFWVKSSVIGDHSFALQNWSSSRRSFLASYTINSANTWEFKSITIPGDTSFAPSNAMNAVGISIRFSQGAGSQYTGSTANSWVTADQFFLSGCVTPATISGATWQITGVQLEEGSVATPFETRQYGQELALCQRYYEKSFNIGTAPADNSPPTYKTTLITYDANGAAISYIAFLVLKRTSATMTYYSTNQVGGGAGNWQYYNGSAWANGTGTSTAGATERGCAVFFDTTLGNSAGQYCWGHWAASAEL